MLGLGLRGAEPDLNAWTEASRLNPAAGAMGRLDDPAVAAALENGPFDTGTIDDLRAGRAALAAEREFLVDFFDRYLDRS